MMNDENIIPFSVQGYKKVVIVQGSFILASNVTNDTGQIIIGSGGINGTFDLRFLSPNNLITYNGQGLVTVKYKGLYTVHFHFAYESDDLQITLWRNGVEYVTWRNTLSHIPNAYHLLESQTDIICDINDVLYFTCTGTSGGGGSSPFSIFGSGTTPYLSWGNISLLEAI
tara:strand:- start:26 stop:535 length:510 start_codon:yes stop_codon:yes gene_type:complete